MSSLLIKAEDQEYNSNSVSRNLNCRASRGRLIETKAKASNYKNISKVHKSCENIQGINQVLLINLNDNMTHE